MDECAEKNTCDANAECTDTPGSFVCTCKEGFSGDGFTCTGKKFTNTCPICQILMLTSSLRYLNKKGKQNTEYSINGLPSLCPWNLSCTFENVSCTRDCLWFLSNLNWYILLSLICSKVTEYIFIVFTYNSSGQD